MITYEIASRLIFERGLVPNVSSVEQCESVDLFELLKEYRELHAKSSDIADTIKQRASQQLPPPEWQGDCRNPEHGCWHVVDQKLNSTTSDPTYCRKPTFDGSRYCQEHFCKRPHGVDEWSWRRWLAWQKG